MKKMLFILILLTGSVAAATAQCGKKINWIAAKFQMVDSSGNVEDTREVDVLIEQSADSIRLSYNGDPNSMMEGLVKDVVCNWKEPYKTGKTTFSSELSDSKGEGRQVSFIIQGIDGKVVITARAHEEQNRTIRVEVERYVEK